ncbi:Protein F38E1.3 [Aphelenchoides avenae]|nr:Protein F38E1.3 [Aphelenchus avenae]
MPKENPFDNDAKSPAEAKKRKKKAGATDSIDETTEEGTAPGEGKSLPVGYEIKAAGKSYVVETKLAPNVYTVKRKNTNNFYCLKAQPATAKGMKQLQRDLLILQAVTKNEDGREHFLPIIAKDHNSTYNFLIMGLADDSLADLRANAFNNEFLPKTSAGRLCLDTFQAVHDLHRHGFLHNDIRPTKFALGQKPGTLYLIGFSLSYILSDKDRTPKNIRRPLPRLPASKFRARSYHKGEGLHAKDDLESWLYLCYDLFDQQALPWNNELDDRNMYSTKEAFFLEAYPEALSKAPRQLQMIMRSLAKLRGPERPDYLFIAMQLLRMKEDLKVNAVGPYEWQVEKDEEASSKATTPRSTTPKIVKKSKKAAESAKSNSDESKSSAEEFKDKAR